MHLTDGAARIGNVYRNSRAGTIRRGKQDTFPMTTHDNEAITSNFNVIYHNRLATKTASLFSIILRTIEKYYSSYLLAL